MTLADLRHSERLEPPFEPLWDESVTETAVRCRSAWPTDGKPDLPSETRDGGLSFDQYVWAEAVNIAVEVLPAVAVRLREPMTTARAQAGNL